MGWQTGPPPGKPEEGVHISPAIYGGATAVNVAVTARKDRAVLYIAWLTANYFIQPLNNEGQLFVGCF